MINEQIQHDTHHLPAASAGGNNAYYLKGCDTVQRSPSYAACLFKIVEIEAGRETDYNRECGVAIRSRQCRAVGMHQEEQLKGQALYFFPRKTAHLPMKVTGDFGVPITNLTDPALIPRDRAPAQRSAPLSKPKPAAIPDVLDLPKDGYAAAINATIAAAPPAPAPAPAPAPVQAPAAPVPQAKPALAGHVAPAARPALQPGETPLQYARRLAALKNPT